MKADISFQAIETVHLKGHVGECFQIEIVTEKYISVIPVDKMSKWSNVKRMRLLVSSIGMYWLNFQGQSAKSTWSVEEIHANYETWE